MGDLAWWGKGGGYGCGTVAGDRAGIWRSADPTGNRPGQTLDIARQWGIVFEVIGGVIPNNIDNWGVGLASIVQIGNSIA